MKTVSLDCSCSIFYLKNPRCQYRLTKGRHCHTMHDMDNPTYKFSPEKNLKLLEERGIGFEDIIAILDSRGPKAVIDHPNQDKYPGQKIYIIEIDGYAYLIPFIRQSDTVILKTIFRSRKVTKQLLRGKKHEREKEKVASNT